MEWRKIKVILVGEREAFQVGEKQKRGLWARLWGGTCSGSSEYALNQTKDDVQAAASWVRKPQLPTTVMFGICLPRENRDNHMEANWSYWRCRLCLLGYGAIVWKKLGQEYSSNTGISKLWPVGQIWLATSFHKWSFIKTQVCSPTYILSMATFTQQRKS